jgi:hypothetical protein
MPAQASGSAGARQRSAPTGGRANGRPFQDQVPERALSSMPSTLPWAVVRTVGASAGGVSGTVVEVVGVMVGVAAAAGGGTLKVGSDDPPQAAMMAHSSTNPARHFRLVVVMSGLLVGLSGMRAAGTGLDTSGLLREPGKILGTTRPMPAIASAPNQ